MLFLFVFSFQLCFAVFIYYVWSITFYCIFTITISKCITITVKLFKLFLLFSSFFIKSSYILLLWSLLRNSSLPLSFISISPFFYWSILSLSAFKTFTMIQITNIFLQELNELTFLPIQVRRDSLSKIAFNWSYSFLSILIWKRLIHLSSLNFFKHFNRLYSMLRWRNKLFFLCIRMRFFILRGIIVFLYFFR